MKKLLSFLISASVIAGTSAFGTQEVYADVNDFKNAFFPNGTINAPSRAPYIVFTDTDEEGNGITSETEMYYELSSDLMNMNLESAVSGVSDFADKYGVILNLEGIQIDVKFGNDGWLSEKNDWNHLDYGENIDPDNNALLLHDYFSCDELERMHYLSQGWLIYYDESDETLDYIRPYIRMTEDEYGSQYWQYDTGAHSVSFRYRYYVTYYPDDYSGDFDTDEGNVIFSGWSPEVTVGSQSGISAPGGIEAPSISSFSFVQNEYESYDARYFINVPQNVYDGIRYYYIEEDMADGIYDIETQVRINDGEWEDVFTEDSSWINDCYKIAQYSQGAVPDNSKAEVRARITDIYGNTSEWSNTLSVEPDYIPEYQDSFIEQALVTRKKDDSKKEKDVTEEPLQTMVSVVGTDRHGYDITEVITLEEPKNNAANDDGKGNVSELEGPDAKKVPAPVVYTLVGLVLLAGAAGIMIVLKKEKTQKNETSAPETDEAEAGTESVPEPEHDSDSETESESMSELKSESDD